MKAGGVEGEFVPILDAKTRRIDASGLLPAFLHPSSILVRLSSIDMMAAVAGLKYLTIDNYEGPMSSVGVRLVELFGHIIRIPTEEKIPFFSVTKEDRDSGIIGVNSREISYRLLRGNIPVGDTEAWTNFFDIAVKKALMQMALRTYHPERIVALKYLELRSGQLFRTQQINY